MRVNGHKLKELYHWNIIDVNFLKENILALILFQLREATVFHDRLEQGAFRKTADGSTWVGIPGAIHTNISLMWLIA